ncbi:MAG: DJ-1/PfpI family protein [Oceanospirillaceae bacterium]|nr:DJ-1/PfpI family protein [Oceanospirillaceae bacterium]
MNVAVLTFEGFNELDSFIASAILNRMQPQGWNVQITCPTESVTSMNNVTVQAQQPLEFANSADIVLFGSGIYTREIAKDAQLLGRLKLNPERQLIGAQCSGALLLAKLGYLNGLPACTDLTTKPWVIEAGVEVLNQPLVASGNIATAGGCLASSYLAAWFIAKTAGLDAASNAIHYVAPTGEKEQYVAAMLAVIGKYL